MTVSIKPGFVQPQRCPDPIKHDGCTPLVEAKQHMIEAHGFVYDEARAQRKASMRRTCPTCHGEGWISS